MSERSGTRTGAGGARRVAPRASVRWWDSLRYRIIGMTRPLWKCSTHSWLAQQVAELLVDVREAERRRLVEEVCGVLGPARSAVAQCATTAREQLDSAPPEITQALVDVLDDLRRADEQVHHLTGDPLKDGPGSVGRLVDKLKCQADQFAAASGGELHVQVVGPDESFRLSGDVGLTVSRVVGEALTNTVRHAVARSCSIRLFQISGAGGGELGLEITDDGVGPADAAVPGVGLTSMTARVRALDGSLHFGRNHPTGTRIRVRIPLCGGR